MNENIIFDQSSIKNFPNLSEQMTLAQAASIGSMGIIKRRQVSKQFAKLQAIAEKALGILDFVKSHEHTFHQNYRFNVLETEGGSTILDIVVLRMPRGAKQNQRLNKTVGYMHNPHWRVIFDQEDKLISCGSFSNSSMASKDFNQFDDICIATRTYSNVVGVFGKILEELSETPVEIERTKKYLEMVEKREAKKAKAKEKERKAKEKAKAKEKERKAKAIARERAKYLGSKTKKFFLTKVDGTKVEVSEEEFNEFQRQIEKLRAMREKLSLQ